MANYYRKSEIRFAVHLEANGFSMDDDDWELEVKVGSKSVYISKEECTKETYSDSSDSDSSSSEEAESVWYAIVDTSELIPGNMRVIATAHIPDVAAEDGDRKEIAVAHLGKLIDP